MNTADFIERHHGQCALGRRMASANIHLGYEVSEFTFDAGVMDDIETSAPRLQIKRPAKGQGK